MIDLNIMNFITIALIAIISHAVLKAGASAAGLNLAWL